MKNNRLLVSSIIVAAGQGTRMNHSINKQYIEIDGKRVLARTLQIFNDCNLINEIILVVNKEEICYCKNEILNQYDFSKIKLIVSGGKERQNSVYNGLIALDKKTDVVVIHDGARPFVTLENIEQSIKEVIKYNSVCLAVPVKDTIKEATIDGSINKTLERKNLWIAQTPQTFKYDLIMKAHENALLNNFIGTDDAVLLEEIGIKTKLLMGNYDNIKITTQEDLLLANLIIKKRKQ